MRLAGKGRPRVLAAGILHGQTVGHDTRSSVETDVVGERSLSQRPFPQNRREPRPPPLVERSPSGRLESLRSTPPLPLVGAAERHWPESDTRPSPPDPAKADSIAEGCESAASARRRPSDAPGPPSTRKTAAATRLDRKERRQTVQPPPTRDGNPSPQPRRLTPSPAPPRPGADGAESMPQRLPRGVIALENPPPLTVEGTQPVP